MKHSKRGGVTFDQDELKEMAERAREFQEDPKMALEHYRTKQWVWFQMLERIIDEPPDTRSGLDKVRWAMQEYNLLAARLFKGVKLDGDAETQVVETAPRGSDDGADGSRARRGPRKPKFTPPAKPRAGRAS